MGGRLESNSSARNCPLSEETDLSLVLHGEQVAEAFANRHRPSRLLRNLTREVGPISFFNRRGGSGSRSFAFRGRSRNRVSVHRSGGRNSGGHSTSRCTTRCTGGVTQLLTAAIDNFETAVLESLLSQTTDPTIAVGQCTGQCADHARAAAAAVLLRLTSDLIGSFSTNTLVSIVETVHEGGHDLRIAGTVVVVTELLQGLAAILGVASGLRQVDQFCDFAGIHAGAALVIARSSAVRTGGAACATVCTAGVSTGVSTRSGTGISTRGTGGRSTGSRTASGRSTVGRRTAAVSDRSTSVGRSTTIEA